MSRVDSMGGGEAAIVIGLCEQVLHLGRGPVLGIDATSISRKHLELKSIENRVILRCTHRAGITLLRNDEDIAVEESMESVLSSGDIIKFAQDKFHFKIDFDSNQSWVSLDDVTEDTTKMNLSKKKRKLPDWLLPNMSMIESNTAEAADGSEKTQTELSDKKMRGSDGEIEQNDTDRMDTSQFADAGVRTACKYGAACKRKNPLHFRQESHPGDPDYTQVSMDDEDKPECVYGVDCYRKNPHHKKSYKHTHKPSEKRAAKMKARELNRNTLLDDDDEFEPVDDSDDDEDYVLPKDKRNLYDDDGHMSD